MKLLINANHLSAKALIFAMLWGGFFSPGIAFSKIYKYKDDQGKTHFTDSPSGIPLKYRKQNSLKTFKGVAPSPGAPASTPGTRGTSSTGKADSGGSSAASKKDEGLSDKQVQLVKKSMLILRKGVALAVRYKGARPNATNGRGAVATIQSNLPEKESLLRELTGTKAKELQPIKAFFQKSVAMDKKTKSIGSGLKGRIMSILNRIENEGQQQATLILKLDQALKNSKKKKAEAKMDKAKAKSRN